MNLFPMMTLAIALVFAFPGSARPAENHEPNSQPDFQSVTSTGLTVQVFSQLSPVIINQIHSWRVRVVEDENILPISHIVMSGGMPDHDHGLPTQPEMTQLLPNGEAVIDGIRFHMPGRWQITFEITSEELQTRASFDFDL